MTIRPLKRIAVAVLASGALIAIFQNCSQATAPTNAAGSSQAASVAPTPILITPAAVTLAPSGTQTFTVTGGNGTYTLTAQDGCGTVTGKLSYQAPAYNTVCTLIVNDTAGTMAYASVTVTGGTTVSPLTGSYNPAVNSAAGSETVTIIATGGSGNYTYSKTAGAGTLAGNVYTTTASGETASFTVSDGTNSVTVSVVIANLVPPTQTVYRVYYWVMSDHMPSLNATDGAPNYVPDGNFLTYTAGGGNRIELRRCYQYLAIPGTFVSAQHYADVGTSACSGSTDEGSLGFIESAPTAAAPNPLYLCNYAIYWTVTKSLTECTSNGYTLSKTLGYIP